MSQSSIQSERKKVYTYEPQSSATALPDVISERKVKAVSYQSEDHIAVLTQLHGSVWPKVLPYCIGNSIWVLIVYWLQDDYKFLSYSDKGHSFMSIMVAFLVVTRSNIAYSRYMEARNYLNDAMKSCRELVQHAVTFTRYNSDIDARRWRAEVARRTIVQLRCVVSVLEYQTRKIHAWKIPELTQSEKQALLTAVGKSNERATMVLAMFMRHTIASQVEFLQTPMHINKELRLYAIESQFVTAYHGLMKLITTPFPFPLVQMSRTFLAIWVFTLPCALADDIKSLPGLIFIVFFLTFGFIGLEIVSIELDDPFGDDPNDFDVLGFAKVVFEDIYISIYDIDGKEAADELRKGLTASADKIEKARSKHARYASGDALLFSAQAPHVLVGVDKSQLIGQRKPSRRGPGFGSFDKSGFGSFDKWAVPNSKDASDLSQIMEVEAGIDTKNPSSFQKQKYHPLRDPKPPKPS